MSTLRSTVKRLLPPTLLHAWRDLKYTDKPNNWSIKKDGSPRVNILRSHYSPKLTIYFCPEQPLPGTVAYNGSQAHRGAVAYKLCRLLGYGITTNAPHRYETEARDPYDVVFKYQRGTYFTSLSGSQFDPEDIINGTCSDISKRAVNAFFEETFGYGLAVDPTSHDEAILVKSNLNSVHDGHVVQGPLAPSDVQAEKRYQRVIDNTTSNGDMVLDYRVPVHGGQIPLVFLKYRPAESRFESESTYATFEEPAEVFSQDEVQNLLQLAVRMGVDFGELDVLRDREDGRIYVVDVNPTPWGPPRGLSEQERKEALGYLGRSFAQLIQNYAEQ